MSQVSHPQWLQEKVSKTKDGKEVKASKVAPWERGVRNQTNRGSTVRCRCYRLVQFPRTQHEACSACSACSMLELCDFSLYSMAWVGNPCFYPRAWVSYSQVTDLFSRCWGGLKSTKKTWSTYPLVVSHSYGKSTCSYMVNHWYIELNFIMFQVKFPEGNMWVPFCVATRQKANRRRVPELPKRIQPWEWEKRSG